MALSAPRNSWCTVNWVLHTGNSHVRHKGNWRKKTILQQRLFGRRVKVGRKNYYYDGLLEGFKNGRKIKLIDYERHSHGVISVPAKVADEIQQILAALKVDHRIIQYHKPENYYTWKYGQDMVEPI